VTIDRSRIGRTQFSLEFFKSGLQTEPVSMNGIFTAYLITFGWALVGSISMGLGIIITLKMFDLSTKDVDEWSLVKEGNIPIAIILASVIISLGLVVSSAVHP
ncbi:DUF350 domain-containing protein, partial [Planctomicrobium sp.]